MADHHHRSTLKQQNKKFKGSSSSKRAIKRINKGKIPGAGDSGGVTADAATAASRQQRQNAAKQVRDTKRQDALKAKRGLVGSGAHAGPRVIAYMAITKAANVAGAKGQVLSTAKLPVGGALGAQAVGAEGPVCATVAGARVTLVEAGRELLGVLDCMSVADVLVLVATAGDDIDGISQHLLVTSRNFAMPSAIVVVLQGVEAGNRGAAIKAWGKTMEDACLREVKVLTDSEQDVQVLERFLASTKLAPRPAWQQHSQLLAHRVVVADTPGDLVGVSISGFIKGKALGPDQLVHIPCYGTYQVKAIERWSDPFKAGGKRAEDIDMSAGEKAEEVLEPGAGREELVMEEEDDGMEGEQTWPSQEELKAARLHKRKVPKYMGEYASTWIPEDDEDEYGEAEADEEMGQIEDDEDDEEDDDNMSMAPEEEERARSEWHARRADEQEQKDYPDEVEVPSDKPARERFARYRGLRSLRTSPWDPYENLPQTHHKIIHLGSPASSRAKALKTPEAAFEAGAYVTVHLERVPRDVAMSLQETCVGGMGTYKPLVLAGLAKYENRMGLVHFRVSSYRGESNAIRSKDTLVLVQGSRRFEIRPVFSEASDTSSNHKMLRFMPSTGSCVASAYAPIWWGPSPVLLMQKHASGALTLVATGSTLPPNANRIILKRIVLSGLPFKIHKRKATVRFMFYNPEDIRWFKAVELWTKYGRRGIIREPLGTHGYMKCTFDTPIAHHDTVCMSLFKRVFPPYPKDPAKQLC